MEHPQKFKNVEKQLLGNEELWRCAITNAPFPIMIHDENDRVLELSDGWEKFSGYSTKDIKTMSDWTELAYGERTGSQKEYIDKLFSIDKTLDNGEWEVKHKDGSKRIWHFQTTPLGRTKDNLRLLQSVALDITDKKLADETLTQQYTLTNSGIESMPIAWILLDTELQVVEWNKAAEKIFGWTKAEIIGKQITNFVVPSEASHLVAKVLSNLQEGQISSYSEKDNNIRKDGTTISCKWYNSPICDESGNVTAILTLAEDITELKTAEDEILKARKLESIGILAGGIAHDFNNILTGLFGNIELVKRKLGPDHAAYANIQNANQALEKATNLTNQLLTFSKGGEPLIALIDIRQAIRDTLKLSLSGSNVQTILELPDDLWQVKADKGQLSQVLTNLILNARQAMPDGGTLTIEAENIMGCKRCHTTNLNEKCVSITIRDEGTGISKAHLEKIFDPYFTTKQTGSGLGLATTHSIINKHNGHIDVDSELSVGTSFTIYLLADSSLSQINDTTISDLTEKSGSATGHILVMDDDEMILSLSKEIIETFGYTVDTAYDGKEAIDKYIAAEKSGKAFDVVIMDLTIPGGMGGKESIKELLAFDPEAKVIVSSGYSTNPIMANYSEYGFKGRLAKPFQMDELQKELSLQIVQE